MVLRACMRARMMRARTSDVHGETTTARRACEWTPKTHLEKERASKESLAPRRGHTTVTNACALRMAVVRSETKENAFLQTRKPLGQP